MVLAKHNRCQKTTIVDGQYHDKGAAASHVMLLTSQYVEEGISLRTGMKTCRAQPSTLHKPVRSCKLFGNPLQLFLIIHAHVFF